METSTSGMIVNRTAGLTTEILVEKMLSVCNILSGSKLYPYQIDFASRIFTAVLEREAEELTGLWCRQCIGPDEIVLDRDGLAHRMAKSPDSWQTKKSAQTYELKARGGYCLDHVTKEHVFFDADAVEKPLGEFEIGECIRVVSSAPQWLDRREVSGTTYHNTGGGPKEYTNTFKWTKSRALLAGLMSSDDYFAAGQAAKFTNVTPEFLHLFEDNLTKSFPDCICKWHAKGNGFDLTVRAKVNRGGTHRNTFCLWLDRLGIDNRFPTEIFATNSNLATAFLQGAFVGDGCIQNTKAHKHIELGSGNNLTYSRYMQALLLKLGVRSVVKREQMNPVGPKFCRLIISGEHPITALYKHMPNLYGYKDPTWKQLAKDVIWDSTKTGKGNYQRKERGNIEVGMDGEQITLAKIISIKPNGIMPVYDREVPDKHWFTCNGFKTHNSGKSESVAAVSGSLMLLMPEFAKQYPSDDRFRMTDPDSGAIHSYEKGFLIGVYAPKKKQAGIIFRRLKSFFSSDNSKSLLAEIGIEYDTDNGETIGWTNGSRIMSSTASGQANIEGDTHHLVILDEAQDIGDQVVLKSIGPMLSSCLMGSTKITDSKGNTYTIEDIVKNKIPLDLRGVDSEGSLAVGSISAWLDQGVRDTLKVTLQSGRSVIATPDHSLLVRRRSPKPREMEWKQCKDISVGMHICQPEFLDSPEDMSLDPAEAYWIGAMVGDGSYGPEKTPRFYGSRSELVSVIKKFAISKGCDVLVNRTHMTERGREFEGLSFPSRSPTNNLISILRREGMYGQTKARKSISSMLKYDNHTLAHLIAGLYDTDGHVITTGDRGGQVCFSQANLKMCQDLIIMLHRLGIHGNILDKGLSLEVAGKKVAAPSRQYQVIIGAKRYVERFSKLIPLITEDRKLKMAQVLNNFKSHRDRISNQYPEIVWDKVISVEPAGKHPVYDLTVSKIHSFVAEGMLSHNCGGTMIKIGTANYVKSHYFTSIQRNKRRHLQGGSQTHFEVDYLEAQKYNRLYAQYVTQEKRKLGESSDAFQMAYMVKFMLHRGMAFTEEVFDDRGVIHGPYSNILLHRRSGMGYAAGIDFGKIHDSTVVTVMEVDWQNPREIITGYSEEDGEFEIPIFAKHICGWLEMQGDDYMEQLDRIKRYLKPWGIERACLDYTGVGVGLGDHMLAALPDVDVEFVTFSSQTKDTMSRMGLADIQRKIITWPAGPECRETPEWINFKTQLLDAEKEYKNGYMSLHHPDTVGARDDYVDALMLAIQASSTRPFDSVIEETESTLYR